MQDFEKLGLFYLGREFDPDKGTPLKTLVLYESRDLVTHAVCVGMTGSGKTGLCLALIEEAGIDGIPVIAIDPKGDLANLALTFPRLTPEDFRPWIDEDDARRASQTPDAFAAAEARRWREGLADWGQDGARIDRLRNATDIRIYTPGSRAGVPVSILASFAAPPASARDDGEFLTERAGSTASSVLSLAGVNAERRSREHTLLSTLFGQAWRDGRDLDLVALIEQVQKPPFQKVGIVDLESFFPSKERFDLAMKLNGLLAAPGFEQWLEGDPLDPATLFYTPEGKPRIAVFSIAHLGDAERMFFVALLLNQIVSWMRGQTGTSSLRSIVYMDEIMGFFPPVANPPAKGPLLTLLKQGRAFGIGVVLATQNPVDLDYKGLANTGTWFLGRLQTDRDKSRMLDGLEGAGGGGLDRAATDRLLSALGKRVFLLHNVHADRPTVFQTRWAMSYLRGPLSRDQIRALTPPSALASKTAEARASAAAPAAPAASSAAAGPKPSSSVSDAPVVPPGIEQFFVPAGGGSGGTVTYKATVLGAGRVSFADAKLGIDEVRDVIYAAEVTDGAVPLDWAASSRLDLQSSDLKRTPEGAPRFRSVPSPALQPRNYSGWEKAFGKWLAQTERADVLRDRDLNLTSRLGESERDFRIRLKDARREARDAAIDAVRKKYATRQAGLTERLRRAESAVGREQEQASQQKLQTALSVGATLLGALMGRKAISSGTIGRATTAARGVGRSMKESGDIKRAEESADAIRTQISELENEIQTETQRISAEFDAETTLERLSLAPKRGQVSVQFVALGWLPDDRA